MLFFHSAIFNHLAGFIIIFEILDLQSYKEGSNSQMSDYAKT